MSEITPFQRILFVRHGRTDWNESMRYQGKSDIPLNEEGLLQARKTSRRISQWFSPEVIYSSPLKRALVTAETINTAFEKPVDLRVVDDLAEMNFGRWEGMAFRELRKEEAELYMNWRHDPVGVTPPGGEPFEQIYERVSRVLEEIQATGMTRILVVSHGGILRACVMKLLGLDSSVIWKLRLDNCAISIVDMLNYTAALVSWNDHIHVNLPVEFAGNIPLPV
jgi:alpha-ribazole phosphatase/probable phosphoglycerate mutase